MKLVFVRFVGEVADCFVASVVENVDDVGNNHKLEVTLTAFIICSVQGGGLVLVVCQKSFSFQQLV